MKALLERCLAAKKRYKHTNEGGDYLVELDGDTIYILFEWSDGKEDWVNNFDFLTKPFKSTKCVCHQIFVSSEKQCSHDGEEYKCHRGFARVWQSMQYAIETEVADILSKHNVISIVCCGYSHGGAMSLFATEDMTLLYGDKVAVSGYGFGGPRVLFGRVPNALKERLKNYTLIRNVPDIVTHVPPRIFGFKHVGKFVRLNSKGKYGLFKAHYAEAYLEQLGSDICDN